MLHGSDRIAKALQGIKGSEDLCSFLKGHGGMVYGESVKFLMDRLAAAEYITVAEVCGNNGIFIRFHRYMPPRMGSSERRLCLCSVASYLGISFDRSGAFQQVDALYDGVASVAGSDLQHGGVKTALFILTVMVCKQAQLIHAVIVHYLAGAYPQPAVQQPVVCLFIEGGRKEPGHLSGRAGGLQDPYRTVGVFGVEPSVVIEYDRAVIIRAMLKAFVIVAHPPGEDPGYELFAVHITAEDINHLAEDIAGLLIFVRTWQYLAV